MSYAQYDLRWQILSLLSTQGAGNDDGLKRELPDTGWHISTATLARDHKLPALDVREPKSHGREYR
jgi:hypothetical protein